MRRILFPTDFSDAAKNAFSVAESLAKKLNAELYILHSLNSVQQYVDISMSSAGDITMPGMEPEIVMATIAAQKERVEKKMKALVAETEGQGFPVKSFIVDTELDFEINNFTEEHAIDFIVMGTHGASGLREAFIGSIAQKIVRKALVPVLTVNDKCEKFSINKVVCSSDFTEKAINEQLLRVRNFANFFEAELELVYINTPSYFEESNTVNQRMDEVIDQYGLTGCTKHIYNAFDIDEGIIAFSEQQKADVIGMVTHGYRGVKKLFSDNVTESVVNHSKIPVLTLHLP